MKRKKKNKYKKQKKINDKEMMYDKNRNTSDTL